MNKIVEFRDVWKIYETKAGKIAALRGIDLEIGESSFVAIKGPSGSGKSTLLHLTGILDTPTRGSILINDKNVGDYSGKEQAKLRRKSIGFIFQRFNLLPQLTALENVILPMISSDKGRAKELLNKVGLSREYERLPTQLSSGEQQRVAIARALANNPTLLLADEPTGELDTGNTRKIMRLMRKLNKKERLTIILATHDPLAASFAEKIIRIEDGRLIA